MRDRLQVLHPERQVHPVAFPLERIDRSMDPAAFGLAAGRPVDLFAHDPSAGKIDFLSRHAAIGFIYTFREETTGEAFSPIRQARSASARSSKVEARKA